MTRKHGAYKISFEMLKAHFNIPGDIFHVDTDVSRGIVRVHVNGDEAPEVPEGGAGVELPLDDTIRERIKDYMTHYNNNPFKGMPH